MRSATTPGVLAICVLHTLAACTATYAPPVRSPHGEAPGSMRAGEVRFSAGAVGFPMPVIGGPAATVAVSDHVAVELGADFSAIDAPWAIGFVGVRLTPVNDRADSFDGRLSLDVELGGGIGSGGELCGNSSRCDENGTVWDGRERFDRLAGGAMAGVGVGVHLDWFAVFLRTRLQETVATGVPSTTWGSGVLGVQFTIADRVALYFAGGLFGYWNDMDEFWGWLADSGLSLKFDVFGTPSPAAGPG